MASSGSTGGRGSAGMAASGCGCAFFGCFGTSAMVFLVIAVISTVIPEWRANNQFRPTECVVLDKRIDEGRNDEGGTTYRPKIRIRYQVGGQRFETWTYDIAGTYSDNRRQARETLDQFKEGETYTCWYDPMEPGTAVLKRGYRLETFMMVGLGLLFSTIGVVGVVYHLKLARKPGAEGPGSPGVGTIFGAIRTMWATRGQSEERRAMAMERFVRQSGMADASDVKAHETLPNVPEADVPEGPGAVLPYRLAEETEGEMGLWGLLLFNLIWNGITWLLVALALGGGFEGEAPPWVLVLFLGIFVLIGLAMLVWLVRSVMVRLGVGPTVVEVSAHPLEPGGECEVLVSQSGRLSINSLRVLLVCEESVRYRQGTDTRTESKRAFEREVHRRNGFEIHTGEPYEARATVRIPDQAMHSFEGGNNAIRWKVVVSGDVANWPDFERAFPLVVQPEPIGEVAPS